MCLLSVSPTCLSFDPELQILACLQYYTRSENVILTWRPAQSWWGLPCEHHGVGVPPGETWGQTNESWTPSAATQSQMTVLQLGVEDQVQFTLFYLSKWKMFSIPISEIASSCSYIFENWNKYGCTLLNSDCNHSMKKLKKLNSERWQQMIREWKAVYLYTPCFKVKINKYICIYHFNVHSSIFWKSWLSSFSPVFLLYFFSTTCPLSWMWWPMAIFSIPLSESFSARRVSLIWRLNIKPTSQTWVQLIIVLMAAFHLWVPVLGTVFVGWFLAHLDGTQPWSAIGRVCLW